MKTALILALTALVVVSILFVTKVRKRGLNEARADKFTIYPDDTPLDQVTLVELGFKIYDTKDTRYALNATGVSMTWVEGQEWKAEVVNSNKLWSDHVYTVGGLTAFAKKHGKELKRQEP